MAESTNDVASSTVFLASFFAGLATQASGKLGNTGFGDAGSEASTRGSAGGAGWAGKGAASGCCSGKGSGLAGRNLDIEKSPAAAKAACKRGQGLPNICKVGGAAGM
eukprot:8350939-Lingulodinium_polyedra.AAC.1